MRCLFVSDLHGQTERYDKLFALVREEGADALLLGWDLLPNAHLMAVGRSRWGPDFVRGFLAPAVEALRQDLGPRCPAIFLILGNDDPRVEERTFLELEQRGLWHYAHNRRFPLGDRVVFGYSCVPPTPFALKDWERYDVSRFVDPGCISPEEGQRTVPADPTEIRYATIAEDLDKLTKGEDLANAIVLFHAPPYGSSLDRAALDGRMVDHAPLDVHVGSIAVRRFIEDRRPLVTLHGHVHEAARLTGTWRERWGRTHLFGGAHDGPELAVITFDTDAPDGATRRLL
jgi:Icc-related predicted phosphoesterase